MANENAKIDNDKLLRSLEKVVNVDNDKITLKNEISLDAWLELKKAVYPINNYITTELTIKFINKLNLIFKNTPDIMGTIMDEDLQSLKEYYGKLNVNSNGYDFIAPIPELSKSFPPITAEVKANIPYNIKKYGSNQKSGIIKDAQGLSTQKPKHNPTDDYKFLVVLDYNKGEYDSKSAVDDLKTILTKDQKVIDVEVVNLSNPPEITKEKIYIVMLGIND